jgi:hypothetical protein
MEERFIMKILILNEMVQGVTKNKIYDVTRIVYQDLEENICEKENAEYETFYYIDNDGIAGYDYRNPKTKECSSDGNDFEVFETDLECAKYLINKYNLNVEVSAKIS